MLKITDVRALSGDSAFLIESESTAVLLDTGFAFTGSRVAENIRDALKGKALDYIFLTHSHYDHALGAPYVLKLYPSAKVVAGQYAANIFRKPTAKALMRDLDRKFASKCGVFDYEDLIDCLRVDITVRDGDRILAKDLTFTAVSLPGHTKCSFGFYLESERLLLSCETLGVFDGEKNIIPSYLVGYQMTLDSIDRARSFDIEGILIPHLGLVEGERADYYLTNAKKFASETCRDIIDILKSGKGKDEALRYFKDRFYHGSVVDAYPIDAMELNTSIMIDLIEKELLS